jgi:hypothetical protein
MPTQSAAGGIAGLSGFLVEFSELFEKFKSFELTGEPVRMRSNFVGGLEHLLRVVPR